VKISVKRVLFRLAALWALIPAGNLGAQQLSIGILRENAVLDWLDPLTGVEFVGRMPITRLMSVQLGLDRGGSTYEPARRDTIIAYTGFDVGPERFWHSIDAFGAVLSLPLTIVNLSLISLSVAPGFRVTRLHYGTRTAPWSATDHWRTLTGPQAGASLTITPGWSPVGMSFRGDWARIRANRVIEYPLYDPFWNTVTTRRFSVGFSWSKSR
jgi:hypothetical protein